jgi:quinol monooxygenase YgiN
MATMLAHIRVVPGRERDFEAAAAILWQRTNADEPHTIRYDYWRASEPSHYYALGCFESYDAFMDHQLSPHHLAASAAFKGIVDNVDVEWIDPIDTANDLPATNMSPTSPNASERELLYRTRYPADPRPWWIPLRS